MKRVDRGPVRRAIKLEAETRKVMKDQEKSAQQTLEIREPTKFDNRIYCDWCGRWHELPKSGEIKCECGATLYKNPKAHQNFVPKKVTLIIPARHHSACYVCGKPFYDKKSKGMCDYCGSMEKIPEAKTVSSFESPTKKVIKH
jgi:hypothetical protein